MKKTILKNGLRIVTVPLTGVKTITLLVLIAIGSKYEEKRVNGISHLLEHMAFKGTKKRPNTLDIVKELDRVGGAYNAFTGKEYMGFWVKVDAKHFDLPCDIVSDMLFNSLFRKQEIEKEKKVVFEEINMIQDNPQNYILDLWEELLYGDQPAGWLISGSKETVGSITRDDILKYFSSQFVANNVVVVAAGNFNEERAVGKLKKFFGAFPQNTPWKMPGTFESQKEPKFSFHDKKTDQTHICLGVRTFGLFDERKYTAAVLAGILGGMMSSRLFIEVREKRSMAYYIRTYSENYIDSGYLVSHAGVDNKRVPEAIKIILKEYKSLKTKLVPKEELSKIKEGIKGQLYIRFETSDSWASYVGAQELLSGSILTPEQECAKIEKVTQNDILKLANEIFHKDKLNLALLGPYNDQGKIKQLLKI